MTSLKAIGEDGQRSGSEVAITNDGVNANEITVAIKANSLNDQDCYVSVLPGVKLTDLNFDITRDGETGKGEQGGFSANYLKDTKKIAEPYAYGVVENTIYTVDPSFLHEYVEITMPIYEHINITYNKIEGTETYKWATMNIGAATSADKGDYFMWGYTVGHTAAEKEVVDNKMADAFVGQTFAEGGRGDDAAGFGWGNYIKFTSGTYNEKSETTKVFTKYVLNAQKEQYGNNGTFYDDKDKLDLKEDAANANFFWGGEVGVCLTAQSTELYVTK